MDILKQKSQRLDIMREISARIEEENGKVCFVLNLSLPSRVTYSFIFVFQIDKDKSGFIDFSELKDALDQVGFKLPGWQVRQLMEEADRSSGDHKQRSKLSLEEFEGVRGRLTDFLSTEYIPIIFCF